MKHFAQKSFSLPLSEVGHVFTSLLAKLTNTVSKMLTKFTIKLHEAGITCTGIKQGQGRVSPLICPNPIWAESITGKSCVFWGSVRSEESIRYWLSFSLLPMRHKNRTEGLFYFHLLFCNKRQQWTHPSSECRPLQRTAKLNHPGLSVQHLLHFTTGLYTAPVRTQPYTSAENIFHFWSQSKNVH